MGAPEPSIGVVGRPTGQGVEAVGFAESSRTRGRRLHWTRRLRARLGSDNGSAVHERKGLAQAGGARRCYLQSDEGARSGGDPRSPANCGRSVPAAPARSMATVEAGAGIRPCAASESARRQELGDVRTQGRMPAARAPGGAGSWRCAASPQWSSLFFSVRSPQTSVRRQGSGRSSRRPYNQTRRARTMPPAAAPTMSGPTSTTATINPTLLPGCRRQYGVVGHACLALGEPFSKQPAAVSATTFEHRRA